MRAVLTPDQRKAERWLRKKFPTVFGQEFKPLAIGAMRDIMAHPARPDVSGTSLRRMVAMRVRHYGYQTALASNGAQRYGLTGEVVGPVEKEHKKAAREFLAARRLKRRA